MSGDLIPREALIRYFGGSQRHAAAFDAQQRRVSDLGDVVSANVGATDALKDATFVTLSANAELPNERVLQVGRGLDITADATTVTISGTGPTVSGGFALRFTVAGDAAISVPLSGTMATRENIETLKKKTLDAPSMSSLGNYASDAAAAAGGVPVGGVYRNASSLQIRVT